MPTKSRELSYADAINEATRQAMELDPKVTVFGQLADTKSGVFGTTTGLIDRFGPDRVHDFIVAENAMTAAAMGASLTGLRPVLVHQRLDFMVYSLDAIANWLALWYFKSNGTSTMPVTIRAIVGKGWGQGPQHSKSLHSWFAHLPGLRVAMPATAFDAKGLLLESIFSEIPAIFIEGRPLYSMKSHVPEGPYRIRFGTGSMRRSGTDITIVAIGVMVPLALKAAELLAAESISVEVIDLRTISPWDKASVLASVRKTGRLVVADPAWKSFGVAGEIVAAVSENLLRDLKSAPRRVCLPDSHTPMSMALENRYYPDQSDIAAAVRKTLEG
jgi:pyruvate/2-oxoglutarate/acetoin dehydrogenase E1 component